MPLRPDSLAIRIAFSIAAVIRATSIGLVGYSRNPALTPFSISPRVALAVGAMMCAVRT